MRPPAGEGGLSRTNQYLRYIINGLEDLRCIRDYRTPTMMRYACGILLHIFAVILAPYFVHFCDSWIAVGGEVGNCPAGYAGSIVFCTISMLLYHIQQDIENPFDMHAIDDVFFEMSEEADDVFNSIIDHDDGVGVRGGSMGSPSGGSPGSGTPRGRSPSRVSLNIAAPPSHVFPPINILGDFGKARITDEEAPALS